MKKLSFLSTSAIAVLFAFVLAFGAPGAALAVAGANGADADENVVELDLSEGILQEGGWIQPAATTEAKPSQGLLLYVQSAIDQEALYATLEQAIESWDGESESVSVDVSDFGIPADQGEVTSLYTNFVNAHGQYFYVTGRASYTYNPIANTIISLNVKFDTTYTRADIDTFNARVAHVMSGVEASWSAEQKILYLHDYLDTHCQYETAKYDENGYLYYTNYNAYNALVEGSAVCQGYSEVYDYLMGLAGVECDVISSSGLNHAWNLVTLEGKRYYIDCTWDDPSGLQIPSYVKHDNLLRSRAGIVACGHAKSSSGAKVYTEEENVVTDWLDTTGDNVYTSGVAVSSTDYDAYYWSGCNTLIPHVGSLWAYTKYDDSTSYGTASVYTHNYATGADSKLYDIADYWYVPGTSSYYPGNYASLSSTGSMFVVAEPAAVALVSTGGARTVKRTLSNDEQAAGRLYGLLYDEATGLYDCYYGASLREAPAGSFTLDLANHVTGVAISPESVNGPWGTSVQLTATVSPANALDKGIIWSSDNENVAIVDNEGVLHLLAVGNATITATSDEYAHISDAITVTVTPAPLAAGDVTLQDAAGLVYDGGAHTPGVTVVHNGIELVEGDEYTVAYRDNVNAGTASVVVTGVNDYTGEVAVDFQIAKAQVTAPIAATGLVYDGAEQVGVVAASNLYAVANGSGVDAGDYTAVATLADPVNYAWPDNASAEYEIPWSIARKRAAVMANDASKTYGEEDPQLTARVEGLVGQDQSDVISYTLYREEGETVGFYAIIAEGAGEQGNYQLAYALGGFTIDPATVDVPVAATGLVYNGPTKLIGVEGNDLVTVSGGAETNAGDYVATASLKDPVNYRWPDGTVEDKQIPWSIVPAPVKPPLVETGLVYNGAEKVGVEGNDLVSVSGGTATDAGDYTAIAELIDPANYCWAYGGTEQVEIPWSIAPMQVDKPVAATGLVYNGAEQDGVASSVLYTVAGGSATDAGDYTAVASFVDARNYTWRNGDSNPIEVPWSIARKAATVTASDAVKTYGEQDPPLTANVEGLVGQEADEADSIVYALSREPGESVGTYAITPSGASEQGNYLVGFVPGTFTIEPADIAAAEIRETDSSWERQCLYDAQLQKVCGFELFGQFGGASLEEGTDFTVAFDEDTTPGIHNAVIAGKGNFAGERKCPYKLLASKAVGLEQDGFEIWFSYELAGGKARIVSIDAGSAEAVAIPPQIDGYDVAAVAAGAFYNEALPESSNAFIRTVVLSSARIELEEGALQGLYWETAVETPDGASEATQAVIDAFQAQADAIKAQQFAELVSGLPQSVEDAEAAAAVEQAQEVYEALTEAQKRLLAESYEAELAQMNRALDAADAFRVQEFADLVAGLPQAVQDDESAQAVAQVKAAYEAMSESRKQLFASSYAEALERLEAAVRAAEAYSEAQGGSGAPDGSQEQANSTTPAKKANPMTVKAKTVKAKAKKTTKVAAKKAFVVKNAKGAVKYKKANKVGGGKIKIAKSGKVTVKKGLKKGTYKVKVAVTAAGTSAYASITKTVTLKIKVK